MTAVSWSNAPMARACAAATRELMDEETDREAAWLLRNPHLWLAALTRLERNASEHITRRKAQLDSLKPKPGEVQDVEDQHEYQRMKVDIGRSNVKSYTFIQHVKNRRDDVKAMIGTKPLVEVMTGGDLAHAFASLVDLLEREDYDQLRAKLHGLAKRASGNLTRGGDV